MDTLEILRRAREDFERRVRAVRLEQLSGATPCDAWSVRDLLQHVIAGNIMAVAMLKGGNREQVDAYRREVTSQDQVGDDPAGAFATTADAQAAAFGEQGALQRTCAHMVGDIPGAQLLAFRVGDLTLHGWDLAQAIGLDETLDPTLVEFVYAGLAPMAETIGQTGMFGAGPSGTVGPDAPVEERLLDLTGRRRR